MNYIRQLFIAMLFVVSLAVSAQAAESRNKNGWNLGDEVLYPSIFYAAAYNQVDIGKAILQRNPGAALQRAWSGMMPIHIATYMGNLDFIEFLVEEVGVYHPFVRNSGNSQRPISAYDLALQGESTSQVLIFFEELRQQSVIAEGLSQRGRIDFENLSPALRICVRAALPLFP